MERWGRAFAHVRPSATACAAFFLAYLAAAGVAEALAIIPDTGISLWPPSGVLVGILLSRRRLTWPWWGLVAVVAELTANHLWFQNPLPVALGISGGNVLEAVTGAYLVQRVCGRPYRLRTLKDVVALVVLSAGLSTTISATIGSATLATAGLQPFFRAWPLLWMGDATGILVVAPFVLVVLGWRPTKPVEAADIVEIAALVALLGLGSVLSAGNYLPLIFITMPALLWAAIRFEFPGAALAVIGVAAITVLFTASGISPFVSDPASQKQMHVLLQLFLATSATSATVVAAISAQRRRAVRDLVQANQELERRVALRTEELRESEQRYMNIFQNVGVSIWETDFSAVLDGLDELRRAGVGDLEAYLRAEPDRVEKLMSRVRIKDINRFTLQLYGASDKETLIPALAGAVDDEGRGSIIDELGELWRRRIAHTSERTVRTTSGARRDVLYSVVYGGTRAESTIISIVDITDRKRAELALVSAAERSDIAQEAAHAWDWEYGISNGVLVSSQAFTTVTGHASTEFASLGDWHSLIHPDDAAGAWEKIHDGFEKDGFTVQYRLRHKHGHYIWVHDQARVLKDAAGCDHVVGMTFDITEEKQREQQMELLMREVNHRSKNILSLVQAVARQTVAGDPNEFIERFNERVRALAANHDLLVANSWQGVDLEALARAQLAPFADLVDKRIKLSGDVVRLSAGAAQSLGLALHELATNAAKYGALAVPDGSIDVSWRIDPSMFSINWVENSSILMQAPTRQGFGTRVIASMAKLAVDGEVEIDYSPPGLRWTLRCPASNAIDELPSQG